MKEKGFTIIEILVVVAIVSILPLIVISNFPQIKLQFAMLRVTYKFAQDLRRVQDLALSSVQYRDAFGVIQPIDGYGIYLNIDILGNKKYIIYADKSPGNQYYDDLDYIIDTIDFSQTEPGIIIQQLNNVFGNSVSINFNPPNPNTTITQLNQDEQNIEAVFSQENAPVITKIISVNTAGLIEIK